MKTKFTAVITFLLPVLSFAQIDTTYQGKAGIADTADSDPALFMFMMFFLMLFVSIILFTAILSLLIIAFSILLVFTGIISASVLAGLYHRSFVKGATAFIRIILLLAGAAMGFVVGGLTIMLHLSPLSHLTTIVASISLGLVAGWLTTNLFLKTSRLLVQKVLPNKQQ